MNQVIALAELKLKAEKSLAYNSIGSLKKQKKSSSVSSFKVRKSKFRPFRSRNSISNKKVTSKSRYLLPLQSKPRCSFVRIGNRRVKTTSTGQVYDAASVSSEVSSIGVGSSIARNKVKGKIRPAPKAKKLFMTESSICSSNGSIASASVSKIDCVKQRLPLQASSQHEQPTHTNTQPNPLQSAVLDTKKVQVETEKPKQIRKSKVRSKQLLIVVVSECREMAGEMVPVAVEFEVPRPREVVPPTSSLLTSSPSSATPDGVRAALTRLLQLQHRDHKDTIAPSMLVVQGLEKQPCPNQNFGLETVKNPTSDEVDATFSIPLTSDSKATSVHPETSSTPNLNVESSFPITNTIKFSSPTSKKVEASSPTPTSKTLETSSPTSKKNETTSISISIAMALTEVAVSNTTSPHTDEYDGENFEGYEEDIFEVDEAQKISVEEMPSAPASNVVMVESVALKGKRNSNGESGEDYDTCSDFDDDDGESVAGGLQECDQRPLSEDSKTKPRPQSQSTQQTQLELLSPPGSRAQQRPDTGVLALETSPFDRIKLLSGASRRALRGKGPSSGKVKKVRGGQASLSSSGSLTHYLTVVDAGLQQLVT